MVGKQGLLQRAEADESVRLHHSVMFLTLSENPKKIGSLLKPKAYY